MARGRSPKCSLTLCRVVNASGAHEQSLQETLVSTTEALPSFTSATTHKPSESLITGIYQCHHTPWRRNNTPIEPSMMREDDATNATNDATNDPKKASNNDSPASEHWDLGERSTNEAGQSPAQRFCRSCGPFKLKGYGQQVNPEAGLSGPGQYDLIRVLSNTTNSWVNTY